MNKRRIGNIENAFLLLWGEWHDSGKLLPVMGRNVDHFDRWLFKQLDLEYPSDGGVYCYQYLPEDVLSSLERICAAGADTGYVLFRAWLVQMGLGK